MQKPIVGQRFKSGTDNICSDCHASLNADTPSEEVLTANLPSRIDFASLHFPTQNAPPHTCDYLHARDYTPSHYPADAIQCDIAAESIHAHRLPSRLLEAER